MALMVYIGVLLVTLIVYAWMKALQINQHWKKHGIPGPTPLPFIGNMLSMLLLTKTQGEILREFHEAFPDEPVVGFYYFMQPRLLIRDRSLIDKIWIKDFSHFTSRQGEADLLNDPINSNLFNLNGNVWRSIRVKFAPMFTTGKLRYMFTHINSVGNNFIQHLEKTQNENVDSLDLMKTYTIDVISTTAFGMQPGPMDDPNNEFRQQGRQIMPANFLTFAKLIMIFIFPNLSQKLGVNFTPKSVNLYFCDALKRVLNHRKLTGTVRNDFVQQMISLQEKGVIKVDNPDASDEYLKIEDAPEMKIEPTDDLLAGQAFAFLLAGFDTTALGLMMSIFDMAANQEIQEKARAEVRKVVDSLEGEVTYDSLKSMEYLEGALKETLRIHSIAPMLFRKCNTKYKLPGIPYTVQVGDSVALSSFAIHMDPEVYPEPEKYLPTRWLDDSSFPAGSFIPFGYGPRICIGMRLAMVEIKSIVAKVLLNYKISLHPSVQLPLTLNPVSVFNQPARNPAFIFTKI
uniref:Cytochrome P450 6k1 n=3 Tax=Lygus hesperus TaxID=30085 RepID=A0A0A9YE48_LYGHE